jgi:hypothetical protein
VVSRRASEFDREIVIDALRTVQDESSGAERRETAWSQRVWAKVLPARGSEQYQGGTGGGATGQVVARARASFEVRWSEEISEVTPGPDYQLRYQGRVWDITSVVEVGRRDRLEIQATARAE